MSYPPKPFTHIPEAQLYELIAQYPLATILSCSSPAALDQVCQVPMLFDRDTDTFIGHVTANNPLVQQENNTIKLLFNGPNAYLSPNHCNNDILPSWLYASVEVTGTLELIKDHSEQLAAMTQLTNHFEQGFDTPWQMNKLNDKMINAMFKQIRFLRITASQHKGNFKLSQNKPMRIREQVIASLHAEGRTSMAQLMLKSLTHK
ncbi:transcriptional regulator [Pseudoalteromonas citrea]|uniref:Transcriptional regulator n=1 Tax=Pseudoalteromonas citrea TaxID=43655 RepID=A0A5S3XTH4_9GAMM|nr:FMN-binding negative transcriptional regulator [Pseudoalteromonas citrea]TMP44765.1 transcriptional regulator [Pseudoalteromonas citrea]TMP61137.1 transcriptional regulator [Pseudoalteromonas citrea]